MIHLHFDRGSLLIKDEVGTPYGTWDPRVGAYRAMALHYSEVLEYLTHSRLPYRDEAADPLPVTPLEVGCIVEAVPVGGVGSALL